jgi:hypothetical protein
MIKKERRLKIDYYDTLEWYFYNQFFASYSDETIEAMLKLCEDFQFGRIGLDDIIKEGCSQTVGDFFESMKIQLVEVDDPLDPYCENYELN